MTDDLKNERENEEGIELERLVGAADEDPSDDALDRVWAKTQAALAQSSETPAPPERCSASETWLRPRVEWWVAGLVTLAALFMFAVLLGRQSGVPLSMPTGKVVGGDPAAEPSAEEIARWIAQLTDEAFAKRQEAWRRLLHGGARTRQALKEFKGGGDAEQDKLVEELRNAHDVLAELQTIPDPESLAFWRAVWRAEVATQPNLWSTGIAMNPEDPQPSPPPSKSMQEVFEVRFGEAKGKDVAARFRKAFDALQNYATWHRVFVKENSPKQTDIAAERRQMDGLLQAVADAGNAAAPVVLSILQVATPMQRGMDWQMPRPKGVLLPYADDHLRMIVAAEKMKLQEAVPVLMKRILGEKRYPSPTVEAHAWGAVWRIYGMQEKAPDFPVAMDELTDEQLAELWTWWVDREVKAWVPLLGDEDFSKREEAQRRLLDLGSRVKPALAKLPPAKDSEVTARLKRIREAYFEAEDCKTVDEAVALYKKAREGGAESDASSQTREQKLEQICRRIEELSPPGKAQKTLGDLHYEVGMSQYQAFRKGGGNTERLRIASEELDKALEHYDEALKADPGNKELENCMSKAAMLRHSEGYKEMDLGTKR